MADVLNSPNLPVRSGRPRSYPFAPALNTSGSSVGSSDGMASRCRPLSTASSPRRGSLVLSTSTASVPPLTLSPDRFYFGFPPHSGDSMPKLPRAPAQTTTGSRRSVAAHPNQSLADLKRSQSLPVVTQVAPDERTSPPFPSPSSSFRSPPIPEAEAIRHLLQVREQRGSTESPLTASRSKADEGKSLHKKRSMSADQITIAAADAATRPPSGVHERVRKLSLRDSALSTGPISHVPSNTSSSVGSSVRGPSRPPSSYSSDVIPSTPGLAKRLSLSTSRRGSENVVTPAKSVVVRDFAFAPSDPRHVGEGPVLPPPSHSRQQSGFWTPTTGARSFSPVGGLTSWDEVANDVQEELTSRGSTSTFSWGFITSHAEADAVDEMALSDDEDEELQSIGLGEIPEGGAYYVATYAFEPEADQEMRLDEGEVVKVYERICQGWVVAGRLKHEAGGADVEEETGLVPENYLAPHRDRDA